MNTQSVNRLLNEWRVAVIGVAALVVLTGLVYFIEVAPILRDRDNYRQSTADLAAKRATLATVQAFVRSADQQIKTLTDRQASELKLEPAHQINDRISMLSSMAGERGLMLESTEPGNAIPQARYSTVAIHIAGHGKFPECVKFIQQLRTQLPDVAINEININGGADGANVNFSFNLLWYAAPEPAVAKTDND